MKIRAKKPSRYILLLSIVKGYLGWIFGLTLLILFIYLLSQTSDVREAELNSVAQHLRLQNHEEKQQFLAQRDQHDDPIVIPGTDVLCTDVKSRITSGEWLDPNQGKVFARETITYPHFYISLHSEEYDSVRWRIMTEGKYYEDEVHNRFVSILEKEPPSFVLDVGANIGYYTLLSASLGHKVISFEPNPANIMRLCDSIRLNNNFMVNNISPEIHIFQNAVSNVHGEEMMLLAPNNPGAAFLEPIEGGGKADKIPDSHKAKTIVVALDRVAEEQGWFQRPDFKIKLLKIDVEGIEPIIIMGASKLLNSGIVEHVLTEGRRFGRDTIRESFAILFDAGYIIKEPTIPLSANASAKDKAREVCDWYVEKLGYQKGKVQDMWWVKAKDR